MLDMGWAELLVIAVVALLAVGPEKLPEVAQGLARLIRQTQRIVHEFREAINLEAFDAELRRSSQTADTDTPAARPPVGERSDMDQDLRVDGERVVESEAIDLGPDQEAILAQGQERETVAPRPLEKPEETASVRHETAGQGHEPHT
ncbi:MAG: twin-arginine translocase subunit TatB [Magnetococcales bacterium]|nr:twin-arginine translocase subunit TatB [Magnetococcales bacterium]